MRFVFGWRANTARLIGLGLIALLALTQATAARAGAIYVNAATTTGSNTGASWSNAYKSLQSAIAAAKAGSEIWVAKGTYKPTTGTDRAISFVMPTSVGIYGGFAGTETSRDQRSVTSNATILSGDIGTVGTASDNSYHVVVGANAAVLDGFTITGGNASDDGGGMINDSVSPTIANCTFTNNTANEGGGMYNKNAAPTVTNCTFTNNTASAGGGGMDNESSSSPTVTNCTFTNNTAAGGGGMYNLYDSSPTVTNCTFTNNTGYSYGGGMYNEYDSSPTVTNCTFTNNTGYSYGGGMYNFSASPTVTNCTFTNNTVSYGSGGGMDGGSATNCTFTNNTASYGSGGWPWRSQDAPRVKTLAKNA